MYKSKLPEFIKYNFECMKDNCSICLNSVNDNDDHIYYCNNNHYFHLDCICKNINFGNKRCPNCRTYIYKHKKIINFYNELKTKLLEKENEKIIKEKKLLQKRKIKQKKKKIRKKKQNEKKIELQIFLNILNEETLKNNFIKNDININDRLSNLSSKKKLYYNINQINKINTTNYDKLYDNIIETNTNNCYIFYDDKNQNNIDIYNKSYNCISQTNDIKNTSNKLYNLIAQNNNMKNISNESYSYIDQNNNINQNNNLDYYIGNNNTNKYSYNLYKNNCTSCWQNNIYCK